MKKKTQRIDDYFKKYIQKYLNYRYDVQDVLSEFYLAVLESSIAYYLYTPHFLCPKNKKDFDKLKAIAYNTRLKFIREDNRQSLGSSDNKHSIALDHKINSFNFDNLDDESEYEDRKINFFVK